MANENEAATHRVRYQVNFDDRQWENFPSHASGHWTRHALEGVPVCFQNLSRDNWFVGTVTRREEFEDYARRQHCFLLTIEGNEASEMNSEWRAFPLPALACEPERIATGEPEPPTADEPPTHTAEVRLWMHDLRGRYPGGMPDTGERLEVHNSRGIGFRGIVRGARMEYGHSGSPMAILDLIGRPVERQLLSRDSIHVLEMRFEDLGRPQWEEMRVMGHDGETVAVHYSLSLRDPEQIAIASTPRHGRNQFYEDFMRFTDPSMAEPWTAAEEPPAKPPKREKPKLPKFGEMPVRSISA